MGVDDPRPPWKRTATFLLLELGFIVATGGALLSISAWLRSPVIAFAPAISIILLLPQFQPDTGPGEVCRNALLVLLVANVLVLIALAASEYAAGLVGGLAWMMIVSPLGGGASLALLAAARARGERAPFVCGASLSVATFMGPFAIFALNALGK